MRQREIGAIEKINSQMSSSEPTSNAMRELMSCNCNLPQA